jgi:hypothetical protein
MLSKLVRIFITFSFTVLFLSAVIPAAIFFRIIGVDFLKLKEDKKSMTYWHKRK